MENDQFLNNYFHIFRTVERSHGTVTDARVEVREEVSTFRA